MVLLRVKPNHIFAIKCLGPPANLGGRLALVSPEARDRDGITGERDRTVVWCGSASLKAWSSVPLHLG